MTQAIDHARCNDILDALADPVDRAGRAIMDVHASDDGSDAKADGSPVTEADRRAERILLDALHTLAPDIPVISEENPDSHSLAAPELFFLVDPLDGTKEFLKRDGQGSFTVNVALIRDGVPVLGIVHAPALGRTFTGIVPGIDANGRSAHENGEAIGVRAVPTDGAVAVASASHRDAQTDEWLARQGIHRTVSIGSSLKFCLVACGEADVYPRFGPTMEWDTAAGHAVLAGAGGRVDNPDGSPFTYGKPDYRNGAFIARGKG